MKTRWSIAAVCAVVFIAGAWALGAFSVSPYANIASIEHTPSFRDTTLLAEAGGPGLFVPVF